MLINPSWVHGGLFVEEAWSPPTNIQSRLLFPKYAELIVLDVAIYWPDRAQFLRVSASFYRSGVQLIPLPLQSRSFVLDCSVGLL